MQHMLETTGMSAGFALALYAHSFLPAIAAEPARLRLLGDWQVEVTATSPGGKPITVTIEVPTPKLVTVTAEKLPSVPLFATNASGWRKGAVLQGVRAQECTSRGLLDPASVQLRAAATPDAMRYDLGSDYLLEPDWGTIGRLPGGRISSNQPVYVTYRHALLRLDSIVMDGTGRIALRPGKPHPAAPLPPVLAEGDRCLANIWLPGRVAKLGPDNLFPILESAYPEPAKPTPTPAEKLLPVMMQKLREGKTLHILAWGDSVTVGTFVPNPERERWQEQFVIRLRERFPQARIELVTEAWGGRNTASYLAEPPGSPHNYREKVLGAKPDLVISEFVNDAGLKPEQVEERYSRLLADFRAIGAEWIILTPHYVRPDWMNLTREREVDEDPRPYVTALRAFTAKHGVALGDASLRYGRLWRQGIPHSSLLLNAINHPDPRGMKLFADSLLALF